MYRHAYAGIGQGQGDGPAQALRAAGNEGGPGYIAGYIAEYLGGHGWHGPVPTAPANPAQGEQHCVQAVRVASQPDGGVIRPRHMPLRYLTKRAVPVRAYFILLVAALVIPLLAFQVVLLSRYAGVERARSLAEAQAMAVRTADALDRELEAMQIALKVLATSPDLTSRDITGFEVQARMLSSALGLNIILADTAGRQVVNARMQPGSVLPEVRDTKPFLAAAEHRKPVVSDLISNPSRGAPMLAVVAPVMRGGQVAYLLSLSVEPARLAQILREQSVPPDWTLTVVDARYTLVARSPEHDRFVGRQASTDLRRNATGERGWWMGSRLDGTPVLAAYDRLRVADWRVAVGVPVATMEAPLRSALIWLAGAGLFVLALSSLLAMAPARRLLAPLRGLIAAAEQLGRGEPIRLVPSQIKEIDQVGQALVDASADLRERGAALERHQARLAAIFNTAPVGILLAEAPGGRIVQGNPQFERIVRHPIPSFESVAQYGADRGYYADGRRVLPHEYPLARALRGEPSPGLECLYNRGDGTKGWIRIVAAPIRGADGAITGGVAAVLDLDDLVRAREAISHFAENLERQVIERTAELQSALDRLRAETASRALVEEQLRQAQKMEAVGRLTGGIAHDFNNLLTIVIGSLDLLRRRMPDTPETVRQRRLLENALQGGQRAATLTARLLAFSRQQPLMPKPLDVNRLVAGTGELLHRALGEQVKLETALADGVWQVHADPNQLESALLNLAVNARDAVQEKCAKSGPDTFDVGAGKLTIKTANAYLDAAYVGQHDDVSPGQYVMIAMSDNGAGMPPEVVAQAFDPFFTTKPQGQGTGMGLSQVHGFVKQSGGHVAISSETQPGPGQGATIKLYLPRYDGAAMPEATEPAAAVGGSGEVILVVEDEEGVRRVSTTALQELGYRVLEADRPSDALRLLDENPDVALLFTDVVLPEASGKRLADEVAARRPGLPVLFTTGYTRNAIVHNGQLDPGVDLVIKPFTLDVLGGKVRELLDRPRPEQQV